MFDQQPNDTGIKSKAAAAAEAYLDGTTTMAGIPLSQIHAELNKPWPGQALGEIPSNKRVKGKSVKPPFVHRRVNQIFGMEGYGWRFVELPQTTVQYGEEERTVNNGELQTWYIVRLEMFVFEYCTITPTGRTEWIKTSPLSDVHANMDRQSAYRGAIASLLKQVVRRLGGFDSLNDQPAQQPQRPAEPQQPAKPAQQPPAPKPAEQSSAGLTVEEVYALSDWGKERSLSTQNLLDALGIKHRNEWPHGLEAAKARVLEWIDTKAVAN